MLLKYTPSEKRTKPNVSSKQQRASAAMKLTVGLPTPRVSRKVMKGIATKRSAVGQQRLIAARTEERTTVDPCDNSNDSGLGFDHHLEFQLAARSTVRFTDQEASWAKEHSEVKRKKLEIKLESDDANDDFSFPEMMSRRERRGEETQRVGTRSGAHLDHTDTPGIGMLRSTQSHPQAIASRRTTALPVTAQAAGAMTSRNSKTQLQIVCQPETQHRARYQTEGSRGAVKDRSGNGFPIVKLTNYNKPATLEVFIGTDVGRIQPHMFYQACRVSGKNSTPCMERKLDGTVVIEVDFDPAKDYVITCDCVGILKERNVDVEHRFPNEQQSRNKKKSTRCRMVFRTKIVHADGSEEWLQITSHPIVCTQPPGVPEICKKSLTSCPSTGGLELFILGKNFLKDTRVLFQLTDSDTPWEEAVQPDKEFLQQTHLVCVVPPFRRTDITEPVTVRLSVTSSGKTSEPHNFTYTPALQPPAVAPEVMQPCVTLVQSAASHAGATDMYPRTSLVPPGAALVISDAVQGRTTKSSPKKGQFMPLEPTPNISGGGDSHRPMMWQPSLLQSVTETPKLENKLAAESKELDRVMSGKMMPPPPLLPISARRASSNVRLIIADPEPATSLKTELTEDGNSQSPEDTKGIDLRMKPAAMKPVATVNPLGSASDLTSTQAPTLATFQRFVTGNTSVPLPNQSGPSVEKYLSNIEQVADPNALTKPTADRIVQSCKMEQTVAHAMFPQQQSMGNVSVPLMYDAQNTTEQKRFSAESSSLLQQGRRKSGFEDALNINPEPDPLLARRHMVPMQDTQSRNPIDQTVSSLMSTVPESPLLLYANAERVAAREGKMQALVSQIQVAENEKLDALVNTMIPNRATTDQTSPIPVKKMTLEPPGYNMMPICDPLLASTAPQLSLDASNRTMFTGHEKTSPLAVKDIINSTSEGPILVESSNQASSGRTVMDALPHEQLLRTSTSPIAVKKIMETSSETQILVTDPNNSPIMTRTSPIAIKSIIEQANTSVSADPCTSPIAMKTILNSEVSESLVPVTTVEALVQSSTHISNTDLGTLNALMPSGAQPNSTENTRLNVLSSLSTHPQPNVAASADSASLSALVQSTINREQQAMLASTAHVAVESARLNALAQTVLSNQQQQALLTPGSQMSDENARLNSLTHSLLNSQNQQQAVMASSSTVSEESARLNSLTQSLLAGQNQQQTVLASSAHVSEESARLSSLTQSLLNSQAQQQEENARLNSLTQSILSGQNQQQSVLVSGSPVSEETARLSSITQSLLSSQNQPQAVLGSTSQVSEENARLNSLTQTLLVPNENVRLNSLLNQNQQQAQVSDGSTRLNSLLLSGQNQQTVLSSVSGESARLNSLTQSLLNEQAVSQETVRLNSLTQVLLSGPNQQQTVSDNMRLNSLTQSLLSGQSQQAVSEETTRLNSLTQSLLSGQTQHQTMLASRPESSLVQPGLTSHRHSDPQAAGCISTIVTQASQTVSHVPVTSVTAGQVLLSTMFATNQNSVVETPTTVIVGTGNMLQGASYTTVTPGSRTLITNKEVQEMSGGSRDRSTGFVTQVLLGLTEEKLKKEAETASSLKEEKPQSQTLPQQQPKKEEALLTRDLAEMSETDLLCYINPSTFDQV